MNINWTRSDDFFNVVTDGNYILAKKIFDSYDAKLHAGIADSAVQTLYTDNHPYCTAYDAAYGVWDGLKSSNKGATDCVVQLVNLLMSTKAKAWDTATQQIYPQGTSMYLTLFPNHRTPFQTGTVLSRVIAIQNFVTAMGTDPTLAAIKTSVQSFLNQLTNARTLQENQLIAIDHAIETLETTRKSAGSYMLFGYGTLLAKNYLTPKAIDVFFPIEFLVSTKQSSYIRTLTNQTPDFLFKHKFNIEKQTIEVINSGDNVYRIYFTNGLTDKLVLGELFIDVQPHTTCSYNPALMNYADGRRHCYVLNMSTGTANVEVDIS